MSISNCSGWKDEYAKQFSCEGVVLDSGDGEYVVRGRLNTLTSNATIMFWAANPPTYTTSFTGSGLPFPNPDIAYDNTPNRGAVKSVNGKFEFKIRYPNAYYVGLGTVYVEPCVHIKICELGSDGKIHTIKLENGIPFRMLTYPPSHEGTAARANPMFYAGRDELPIRTQEQILRDSAFPEDNKMPTNFWGKSIPHP